MWGIEILERESVERAFRDGNNNQLRSPVELHRGRVCALQYVQFGVHISAIFIWVQYPN